MTKIREVVVASDPTNHGALVGHVGESQFPVGVSFHHGEGERDSFERTLVLGGELDAQQRAFLLEAANLCPVGKILGISADINTRLDATTSGHNESPQASYEDDLAEFQIPNINPD
jgi:putative redox protein